MQAIQLARQTNEELALAGCGLGGMDMTTMTAKLARNPPVEVLQLLIDWPKLQ
ncbi:hypothetical protein [Rhizobium lusitanum]|uniref:Uncharacterized protein n=1 Tax=Rhizobium lusitanum TaxID=293958 RepID=A0A7X0MFD0_9HYPH|nr:hypothetical protein [Rhizobium lusitanum]MBB6486908.1 hypothetical protein [Rhizobium lusitanum]